MSGKRLVAAVFATFEFDPAFFERHVLPVFFDVPITRSDSPVALVQLADALLTAREGVAVYYDQGGLTSSSGEAGGARLDVRRIRVARRTGIFHPKNVFALVEAIEPDESGSRALTLLVAALSANLTQTGWWENVEVCHVEELADGAVTRMKDGILDFLKTLERSSPPAVDEEMHRSLRAIRRFVQRTSQKGIRREGGMILPHFYAGNVPVEEFLLDVAGNDLRGMNLEIISPFFDKEETSAPLEMLLRTIQPEETRVFLPRAPDGTALVDPALFDAVRNKDAVSWGRLPQEVMSRGKAEDLAPRRVHAKVYRFFQEHPKRELLFVGSVNLTRPAHQGSGNLESGIFLEIEPQRRPEFWMEREGKRPHSMRGEEPEDDISTATEGRTALSLRFDWRSQEAFAFWAAQKESPRLLVETQGVKLFELNALVAQMWTPLDAAASAELHRMLPTTSIVEVTEGERLPVPLLIEEEGMYKKPSLLSQLSLADILKYWSLLTADQRNAFLESRVEDLLNHPKGADVIARARALTTEDSVFDRFAGIFHSFHCLETTVLRAIDDDNDGDATARLFGRRVDSLPCVLDRALAGDKRHDEVDRYIVMRSAQQMVTTLKRVRPEFWGAHGRDAAELDAQLKRVVELRDTLIARGDADMGAFMDFFDKWFLRRASPQSTDVAQEAA